MEIQELAEKLQKEGVAKGKVEAEKVIAEAKKTAEKIVASAKKDAEDIIARAKLDTKKLKESGKNSLQLSARDVMLKLQQDISAVLNGILEHSLAKTLREENTFKQLLEILLKTYTEQQGAHQVVVEVPENVSKDIQEWLTGEMKTELKKQEKMVGFCIQEKDGGKVEVTVESIREVLVPYLRGVVKELVTQEK